MTAENWGWLITTIIATPVSSLLCCWFGLWFQHILGIDNASKS